MTNQPPERISAWPDDDDGWLYGEWDRTEEGVVENVFPGVEYIREDLTSWQDISTAPRDGSEILLHLGKQKMTVVASYDGGSGYPFRWRISGGDDSLWNVELATHWMPKPPDPAPPETGDR